MNFDATLAAAQAGGEWAFAQLFAEYQPALLRYLRGQAPELADDIASEAWLAAAGGLRGFRGGPDEFRAWLFTIARHRLIDERRRSKRRPVVAPGNETVEMAAVASPSPEAEVLAATAGDEAARRIVALLPSDQAEVILLRVVADLSVDQVARIVGKRPGTVRVLQSRGLKRLAERISEKGVTPGDA